MQLQVVSTSFCDGLLLKKDSKNCNILKSWVGRLVWWVGLVAWNGVGWVVTPDHPGSKGVCGKRQFDQLEGRIAALLGIGSVQTSDG